MEKGFFLRRVFPRMRPLNVFIMSYKCLTLRASCLSMRSSHVFHTFTPKPRCSHAELNANIPHPVLSHFLISFQCFANKFLSFHCHNEIISVCECNKPMSHISQGLFLVSSTVRVIPDRTNFAAVLMFSLKLWSQIGLIPYIFLCCMVGFIGR